MTNANDKHAPVPGPTGERILDHNRLQLSALMDGAVSPDEARFLLRRLQHDEDLAGCWTRWQLCGDVLRGNASTIVPAGFSQRVASAIAAEAGRPAHAGSSMASRWARWGGGAALAASVAVIALFVSRQMPDSQAPAQAPAQIATAAPTPAQPMPASPSAPDTAAQLAAAVAVADVPRRVVRRSRGQSQRAAIRTPVRGAPQPQVAIAASVPAQANPFAPSTVAIQSRPWPRALLPNAPANGAFTVEYGSSTPSFYPFAPRTTIAPGMPANSDRANADGRDPTP